MLILLLTPSVSFAFTENTATPTQNNTPIPINTSDNLQVKTGALASDSYLQADVFYDRYNSDYYMQPRGTNILNYVVADNTLTYGEVQGAYFRDRDDGDFYVDPNGWTLLKKVQADIYYDRNNTEYYVNPNGNSRIKNLYADYIYSDGYADVRNIYLRDAERWATDTSSFGGIWTINLDGSCRYANYKTGGCSCPAGYGTYPFNDFAAGANCETGFYRDGWRTKNCGIIAYYCGR